MKGDSDDVRKQLFEVLSKDAAQVMIDIQRGLMEETPVDTGWAQNNWIASLGVPVKEVQGSPDNITPPEHGIVIFSKWKIKGPAYIRNNVPYITELNEGSSQQAPSGYVDDIIETVIQRANNKRG